MFYGRAVNPTMLTAITAIASQQSVQTAETMKRVKKFLDYCASQDNEITDFQKSDMKLAGNIDTGYLSNPKACSRAGGHFFVMNSSSFPPDNGVVLTVSQTIKTVMSSTVEAEFSALFINARQAVYMRKVLKEMGHKQDQTPMQTYNSTA